LSGYKITGANGDTITFDYDTYVLNPSLLGLGIPPTSVRIDESTRAGGVWRNTRRVVRNVDLPVTVLGTSATDVETKLRRLSRLTQDLLGPTTLTAIRSSGDLTLQLHYTGGAELSYGGDTGGDQWARLVLSFQAPQPFWESATTESFSVTAGDTGQGLLPQLSKLRLSSSQSLGIINVDNTSDVAVFPVYEVAGPITALSVSNGTDSWGFNTTIAEGDLVEVDTEAGTVTGTGGTNLYSILNPAPKLFSFPPGQTTITIEGTSTNLNTRVTCRYNLRYEVVHG
tara:strand:- start:378 stop:1229 length:852 start_codon:yes stop_codon:yes gene_type:complete